MLALARGISVVRDAPDDISRFWINRYGGCHMEVNKSALFTTTACKYTSRAPESTRERKSTLRMTNNSLKAYQICSPHVRG